MNILFISSACSEKVFHDIFQGLSYKSGIAIQKFHRLLLEGFSSNSSNSVQTLTTLPISQGIHKKRLWNLKSDKNKGVSFNYVPIFNFVIIKNTMVFFYSFFKLLFWKFPNKDNKRIIICDVLSLTITSAALLAAKIRRIKIVGIVTDIPGISVRRNNFMKTINSKIAHSFLYGYDGYILLTEQMNEIVNPYSKPFIIMEGLVDYDMNKVRNHIEDKKILREIIYAGALYERYGIKNLIESFMKLTDTDLRLVLFGEGPMRKEMPDYIKKDSRIIYLGVVANYKVLKRLNHAVLLVNPRPASEEFSKYSFPSKNLEFMVSGTPLVTNLLPGIPKEYYSYVYSFKKDSVQGMYETFKMLLAKPNVELHNFGLRAKNFVLEYKNNHFQSKKITDFFG